MPSTHVIMCMPRFVPAILAGTKRHTIRANRKRMPRPGDVLDLRRWLGKPYRSSQQRIGLYTCSKVRRIAIFTSHQAGVVLRCGVELSSRQVGNLAKRDGFSHGLELLHFFAMTHGPVFKGYIIEWNPFAPAPASALENGEPATPARVAPLSPVRSRPAAAGKRKLRARRRKATGAAATHAVK